MKMLKHLAPALLLFATPLQAADFSFCWIGGGGYTMVGRMTIAPEHLALPPVTEQDVTRFKIAGYLDGGLIGTWDMSTRAPDASWRLNFDPQTLTFMTPAQLGQKSAQEWNANGFATNCGLGGFGFNAGDYAQDFCLNGQWIEASGIASETPFYVSEGYFTPDCRPLEALAS